MNKRIFLVIAVVLFGIYKFRKYEPSMRPVPATFETSTKKKILIFTSPGGGGHMATTKALHGYLDQDYEIVDVNIFSEVLSDVDVISWFSGGKSTGEDFYNWLMTKQYVRALHLLLINLNTAAFFVIPVPRTTKDKSSFTRNIVPECFG